MSKPIVCDTNVWYDLSNRAQPQSDTVLIGTLINVIELIRSNWLPEHIEVVRKACVQLMLPRRTIRIDPPMVHIARISDIDCEFDSETNARDCLDFVCELADGADLRSERISEFRSALVRERSRQMLAVDGLNNLLKDVRLMGISKRDPNRDKSLESTKRLITTMVSNSTKREVTIDQINWDEIELFLYVTHSLHLEMEVSKRRFQPNDLGDQYNLVYVGKDELYWTAEQRWIRVVQSAGMGHYLKSDD